MNQSKSLKKSGESLVMVLSEQEKHSVDKNSSRVYTFVKVEELAKK